MHPSVGPYVILEQLSKGAETSVYRGGQIGASGFVRQVAIKRLEAPFASDPDRVVRFFEEARLGASVRHPNVLATLDLVAHPSDVLLVMTHVRGVPLARWFRTHRPADAELDPATAVAIAVDVLEGLHAIHEARDEWGTPLEIVHRAVTPADILIGTDGVARIGDFGFADAMGRAHIPRSAYPGPIRLLAPELLGDGAVDRRADVYACMAVLWELLTFRRLFSGTDLEVRARVLHDRPMAPSTIGARIPRELDAIIQSCLEKNPDDRPPTAAAAARALCQSSTRASPRRVATWVAPLVEAQAALAAFSDAERSWFDVVPTSD